MKYMPLVKALALIVLGVATSSAAESTYTVPAELKPMSTWRNGWSVEETKK